MNKKDYYEILGISKNANDAEIKNAYRKLAREHHPDMVAESDKKDAETRFKEINEAYQVLSDGERRKMYDQFGHAGFNNSAGGGANSGFGGFSGNAGQWGPFNYSYSGGGQNAGFDPMDIFEEFFGFRGFGGQRAPKKGKNLYYEIHVSFEDAIFGSEKEVNIESGKTKIKIPQGARNGTELRFVNKGMPGPKGSNIPNGDLFITIRVSTPRHFERYGDDLATLIEINAIQAMLGDTVEVSVIDLESKSSGGIGVAKLKIPEGTQPNTNFKLKGKGMPRLQGKGQGDLIVQVKVVIPTKLSKKQKKLLEEVGL